MLELGKEGELIACGKTWRYSRLTIGVVDSFRDWIREQEGDPLAAAERFADKLPREEALALVREGKAVEDDLKCFSLATATAKRYLATERGQAKLWQLLLLEHQPGTTIEQAWRLIVEVGEQLASEAIRKAEGRLPNGGSPPVTS